MEDNSEQFPNIPWEDFTSWSIQYSSPDTLEEQKALMVDLLETLWSCSDEFVRPVAATVQVFEFPPGQDLSTIDQDSTSDPDAVFPFPDNPSFEKVDSATSLDWEEVVEPVSASNAVPGVFRIDSTRTKIRLGEGDVWIEDEVPDSETLDEFTHVSTPVILADIGSFNDMSDPSVFVDIMVRTNLWAESGDEGAVNRQQLRRLIECICDARRPQDIRVDGYVPFLHEPNREIPDHVAELHPDNLC